MMQSMRVLLHEIVDYAGLFPPASLDLPAAVRNYAAYCSSAEAWMLGRFILPIADLHEFERIARPFLRRDGNPWLVNVLGSNDPQADRAAVEQFNRRNLGAVFVDAIELKAAGSADVRAVIEVWEWSPRMLHYFEIPIERDPQPLIATLAEVNGRAKVRTGGTTPDMFPSSADLARFLDACVQAQAPFKATAGLHHPLRSEQRLTYADDSPRATMHGFLNVFLATALLCSGADRQVAVEMLEETSPAALHVDNDGIRWRDHVLSTELLAEVRENVAISFGSCSFREPVDEVQAMGLL